MKLKNIKGFTLIELMVVVVIIGILAAMALPKFLNASVKSKVAEAPSLLTEFEVLQMTYAQNGGSCGGSDLIGWTLPGNNGTTKFYNYYLAAPAIGATAATSNATATPKTQMGILQLTDVFQDQITAATASISHTTSGSMVDIQTYCPNWK